MSSPPSKENNPQPQQGSGRRRSSTTGASTDILGRTLHNPQTSFAPIVQAAEQAQHAERQRRLSQSQADKEASQTAYAVAHAVGMDGALNVMLSDPSSPGSKLSEGGESVMRRESEEPMAKRVKDEVMEVGGVVKEALGKTWVGRRFSGGGTGQEKPSLLETVKELKPEIGKGGGGDKTEN